MILKDITDYLESIAPLRFQEHYDNSGLIVGDPSVKVSGAMISLDMTPEVVQEAIDKSCNVVIAHHPIIFKGIKKFRSTYYVDQAVILAIKHDIALYAIHTNLDNVLQHGVNQKIAQRLDLQEIQVLRPHPSDPMETDYQLGSGALGTLAASQSGEQFVSYVKDKMNLHTLKRTAYLDRPIQKVALCGGSGSFLLPQAIKAEADVYITADMKYHEYFDANGEILILDIGHYESEYFTIELLHSLMCEKYPNFAAHCTKVNTNPVFYS